MIEQGATDYNHAMIAAAEAGHEDIVRLMLFRGANNNNEVLIIAARKGIILGSFMLRKAASLWMTTELGYTVKSISHTYSLFIGEHSDKTQLKALKGMVYIIWNRAVVLLFMFSNTFL